MSDETEQGAPRAPRNVRILYAGAGITRIRCGDVLTAENLEVLGISVAELVDRGEAELTDDAATIEPAASPAGGEAQ